MMLGNTENVSSDNIIAEETQNVNTSEEITTPTLTDKCELHETTHTKTGETLWVISLNDKITSDEYKALKDAVEKVGGYYSRFAKTPDGKAIPGFIFKSEPDADVINTFNSFFGTETTDETSPAETVTKEPESVTPKEHADSQPYVSDNGYTVTDNKDDRVITIKFDKKPSIEVRTTLNNNAFVWNKTKDEWTRSGNWYARNSVNDVITKLDNAYKSNSSEQSNSVETGGKITVGMSDDVRAELLNKKSVSVVRFDTERTKALDDIDFDSLQKTLTRHAKPIIEKVAKDFGILNKTYSNPDIELDFEYSKGSLKESINKQHTMYGGFVKMLSVFPDIISNAVGIETHTDKYKGTIREDTSLKQMYVLASALSDEKGIIPIKLEVKEFNDKADKLYLSVVLTKKESRYPHGNLGQNQLNTATPTSVISIADLVNVVNPSEGDFLKYFPDSMLDSKQIESKNKALAKENKKVENLKKPLNDKHQSNDGIKEIDVNSLLGAVENAKVGDEIKLSDHEKQSSTEQALKNETESDIMSVKEDLKGGNISKEVYSGSIDTVYGTVKAFVVSKEMLVTAVKQVAEGNIII